MRKFVRRHPFLANALVAASCTSCGDWITQLGMEEKRPTSTTTQPSADESVGRHEHSEHEEPDEEPAVEPDAEPDASEYDMRRNLAFTAFGRSGAYLGASFTRHWLATSPQTHSRGLSRARSSGNWAWTSQYHAHFFLSLRISCVGGIKISWWTTFVAIT